MVYVDFFKTFSFALFCSPKGGVATNEDATAMRTDAGGESPAVAAPAGLAELSPPLVQLPLVHIDRQVYSQQGFFHRYPPTIKEKVLL